MQQLKQNRSWVLEHMITFSWDDVRVIFLLQVSIVLSFIFLIGSKKLPGSPLCRCPMKSVLAAYPKASARSMSFSNSMGTGAL